MSSTPQRDMYRLIEPGFPFKKVKVPDQDPLAATRYSCIYWVDHFYDLVFSKGKRQNDDLPNSDSIYLFLKAKYLYWLEALSLCKSMLEGVVSMTKLEALIQGRTDKPKFIELVRDAYRFILSHKEVVENNPLQVYISALIFSPRDKWSPCLYTLKEHRCSVNSVAFSHDSARLATASDDDTVKIWDASSGECLQTRKGHSR
ncbi:NWD1 like protein, partial [Delitschia confertaspora ATCC 74209]